MQQGGIFGSAGLLAGQGERRRRVTFLLCLIMSISLTFLQLGFVAVGVTAPHAFCILPLLGPIVATSLLLGAIPGAAQGALAGAILLLHARVFPGSITEYVCVSPLAVVGLALSGLVFGLLTRHVQPQEALDVRALAPASLAASVVEGALFHCGLIVRPLPEQLSDTVSRTMGLVGSLPARVVFGALLAYAAALLAGRVARALVQPKDSLSVRVLFRLRLLGMVSLVLLVGASSAFVRLTEYCRFRTDADMTDESEHLIEQIRSQVKTHGGVREATPYLETMVSMYDLQTDGSIAIYHGNKVVATNSNAVDAESWQTVQDAAQSTRTLMAFFEPGTPSMQLGYMRVAQDGDLSVQLVRPAQTVYQVRFFALSSIATTTVILLGLVYIYAARLLSELLANPIDQVNETLQKITAGNLDEVVEARGSLEFASLSDGINTTVGALKDYAEASERRIAQDLATARRIQQGALPQPLRLLPNGVPLDVHASMTPAREVGGDFYDFFLLDRHRLGFLIADVSGKGIPAALFMMEAKNEIGRCMRTHESLTEAMVAANAALCATNDEVMFVTVWAAVLDWETGELSYVNAGHNPPLLRHEGSWEWLDGGRDLLMGIMDTARYKSHHLCLSEGDALLLYTDGVTEAMDPAEQLYGAEELRALVQAHANLGPHALVEAVRADIARWANGAEPSDDLTLLALELEADVR